MSRSHARSLLSVALVALALLCARASALADSPSPSPASGAPPSIADAALAGGTIFSDPDCAIDGAGDICVASGPLSGGYGPAQQIQPVVPLAFAPTAGRWDPTPAGWIKGGPSIVILPDSGARYILVRGTDDHLWGRTNHGEYMERLPAVLCCDRF